MKREFITLVLLLAICGVCAADFSYVGTKTSVNAQGTSTIGSVGSGTSVCKTTTSPSATIEASISVGVARTVGRSIYGSATGGSEVSAGSQTTNTGTTAGARTWVDVTGPDADGQADGQADGDASARIVR